VGGGRKKKNGLRPALLMFCFAFVGSLVPGAFHVRHITTHVHAPGFSFTSHTFRSFFEKFLLFFLFSFSFFFISFLFVLHYSFFSFFLLTYLLCEIMGHLGFFSKNGEVRPFFEGHICDMAHLFFLFDVVPV
jgi:hypothetical protein